VGFGASNGSGQARLPGGQLVSATTKEATATNEASRVDLIEVGILLSRPMLLESRRETCKATKVKDSNFQAKRVHVSRVLGPELQIGGSSRKQSRSRGCHASKMRNARCALDYCSTCTG
jgi:hypothetical protein